HNPAGIAWDEATLREMGRLALEHGATIVSDEIHAELLLGGTRHRPIASLSPETEERTITLVAPSKTFNIAGLFCGFAIIPDAGTRKAYEETVERMTLHASGPALIAADEAYSGSCDALLAELRVYLEGNRDYALDFVRREMPRLRMSKPEATYLTWIDCSGIGRGLGSPYDFFLEKAKIALNDGATFGTGGRGFLRLNLGCPRATLAEALDRMRSAVASL
ncbi:MAG: aminotransferase class I/II-fold pyridoxal phosphate-dependent enzyme, partial [Spirochaetota bacterium]